MAGAPRASFSAFTCLSAGPLQHGGWTPYTLASGAHGVILREKEGDKRKVTDTFRHQAFEVTQLHCLSQLKLQITKD